MSSGVHSILKFPSRSVTTPLVVPLIVTAAPMTEFPSASMTVPVTALGCAFRAALNRININNRVPARSNFNVSGTPLHRA
jgi:hypothetical protein